MPFGNVGSRRPASCMSCTVGYVSQAVARDLLVREHYLHSFPGGTQLAFGIFAGHRLLGAITLGAGPANAHRLVGGASQRDCLTLSRLWLSDELPLNSESHVLGQVLRSLRQHTEVKFLITYADPAHGHVGTIYQASNWSYTGLSDATPLYDLGDGRQRHSRSVAQAFGTRSLRYLKQHGIAVRLIKQLPKHRYVFFLDRRWRSRLLVPILPYPKPEVSRADR